MSAPTSSPWPARALYRSTAALVGSTSHPCAGVLGCADYRAAHRRAFVLASFDHDDPCAVVEQVLNVRRLQADVMSVPVSVESRRRGSQVTGLTVKVDFGTETVRD